MLFAVPLFRPSNNSFPINLILGAVSRRNEIMFTVNLFWYYLQNNIVQRIFKIIRPRFTSNKSNFYLHQQRSVAVKYANNGSAGPSRLGRGTPLPLLRRFWCLDPRACCARFSTRAVPLFETFRRPCNCLQLPRKMFTVIHFIRKTTEIPSDTRLPYIIYY